MYWLYHISILFYGLLINVVALFNSKAKLFIDGRKNVFQQIKSSINSEDQPIWFHFASLGEFEQGRPVLEEIKTTNPEEKIIITFFSPSGYEIRKNYPLADAVFYLPLDTPANAKNFIKMVNPKMAIFTKYEFWPNYFRTLAHKNIPLYLISGIFRQNQVFFKWYGGFYRGVLKYVDYFFVQNEESESLLKSIHLTNVAVSGDTRFDRVYENAQHPKEFLVIKKFCEDNPVIIAGSTWLEDEKHLVALAATYPDWKVIIAPHEIHASHINQIEQLFPEAIKYSDLNTMIDELLRVDASAEFPVVDAKALIIDNIGMLSALYQYGKIAYIGGGFGAGIHNTLEAAAYGLPVIFGPNYQKFQEAKDLIANGAAKSIATTEELLTAFDHFNTSNEGKTAASYVANKKGATDMIMKKIFATG